MLIATASSAAAGEQARSAIPVLLVDDDPRNLLVLESILESPDYCLYKAQTGEAALTAVMEQDYAAIVLDVQMPDLSGIELARLIKQRKKTQHIPIIFLTAHYRENEHAVLGYGVGAVDYLTKPVHPAVLRSKVSVFVDLFRKTRALAELNDALEAKNHALERQAEDRLLRIRAEAAQAEAEAANAAKDRFLAMLSHELRTPLSPVLHSLTLLEEQPDCSPETREILKIIRRNVQLEARLIDDLLDLARIRNGKLQLQLQSIDAHELLHHALEICQPEIVRHGLRVETRLAASSSILQADPARLQQIFWNLIKNAVKFTPEGGTITLQTSNNGRENVLRVEVTDTGIGIEPERLTSIFDAFEQATPNAPAGLGLGLAICKALTEFHGGSIFAHSVGAGQGAMFAVSLPIANGSLSAAPPGARTAPTSPACPLRVLVVDDHQDTATTLARLLTRRGYEARCAGSVAAALDAARTFSFDVLVTDIGLPDGTGIELFRSLKTSPENQALRGIALSGFGMEEDVDRSKKAGFSDHLTKPVDFSLLQLRLSEIGAELSRLA